jgi:hypothetical protein
MHRTKKGTHDHIPKKAFNNMQLGDAGLVCDF